MTVNIFHYNYETGNLRKSFVHPTPSPTVFTKFDIKKEQKVTKTANSFPSANHKGKLNLAGRHIFVTVKV